MTRFTLRFRFVLLMTITLLCLSTLGQPLLAQGPPPASPPSDSVEAARVADWVRTLPPIPADEAHYGVIGALSFVAIGPQTEVVRQQGPAAFYADPQQVTQAGDILTNRLTHISPLLLAGGLASIRDVQTMPWGMVEVSPGLDDYRLSDLIVSQMVERGHDYVATVMPYNEWDLAARSASTAEMCQRLMSEDFFYLAHGGVMDRYTDLEAFTAWLGRVVERYDGDGVDDMPGLLPGEGITAWQIHNEPEGEQCGGFRNDAGAFVALMQGSYEAVHDACPDCVVLNGGAAIPLWREGELSGSTFWQEYADLGGADYVDVIAVHYNNGKIDGGSEVNFATQINRMRELLGEDKPVWVTEFGVFSGFGGQFIALPEAEAGAWFVRFYTVGLANGATRFYSDTAAFVRDDILLPYYVNKQMEAMVGDFSAVEELATGQYRFTTPGGPVYILWNGIPATLHGITLQVTDLYGNQTTTTADALTPSPLAPLFVEPQ